VVFAQLCDVGLEKKPAINVGLFRHFPTSEAKSPICEGEVGAENIGFLHWKTEINANLLQEAV